MGRARPRPLPSGADVAVGGPRDAAPQQAGQGAPKLFALPSGRCGPGLLEGAPFLSRGTEQLAAQSTLRCVLLDRRGPAETGHVA